jgi:plastocyanin
MVSVENPGEPMLPRASLALLITLAACSSSSSSNTPDAAKPIDAPPPTVMEVTCPATPAASITAVDDTFAFMPSAVSINVGQVVKFTMPGTHNVVPNPTMSDPGLNVKLGATTCLMFTHAGMFGFHCEPHGFPGTVTVQ